MVESEAKELSEEVMLGAVMFGHEQMPVAIKAISELASAANKPRWEWQPPASNAALAMAVAETRKPDAEVIRDLDSGDPRLRDYAVRVLADRRNPAAVPRLVARLKDPDPAVVERAVGALGQIRDPRAVVPLIELTYRREPPFVAQLPASSATSGGPRRRPSWPRWPRGTPTSRCGGPPARRSRTSGERARLAATGHPARQIEVECAP